MQYIPNWLCKTLSQSLIPHLSLLGLRSVQPAAPRWALTNENHRFFKRYPLLFATGLLNHTLWCSCRLTSWAKWHWWLQAQIRVSLLHPSGQADSSSHWERRSTEISNYGTCFFLLSLTFTQSNPWIYLLYHSIFLITPSLFLNATVKDMRHTGTAKWVMSWKEMETDG